MTTWKEKESAVRQLEKNGKVNPVDLVEAARDPEHPCHSDFTWDIEKAASERWRDQARSIIRKCKFEVIVGEVTTPVVRYVHNDNGETPIFESVPKIRSASKTSDVIKTELAMLHGNAARVYGIALSKESIVGSQMVSKLETIKTTLQELKESLK